MRDWLNEDVRIRVEAIEMVHCIDSEKGEAGGGRFKYSKKGRFRSYFSGYDGQSGKDHKPLCALCEGSHGVWSCKRFQGMNIQDRWNVA